MKSFTIIENIIAMVVLAVMIVASLSAYPLAEKVMVGIEHRLIAANLAYSQMEDLKRIAHDNFSDALLNNTLGGGRVPTTDIAPIVPAGYALTYDVAYTVPPPNGNPWPKDITIANIDYKTVTVRCSAAFRAQFGSRAQLKGYVAP